MSSYTGEVPKDYSESRPQLPPGQYVCTVADVTYNVKADATIAQLIDTGGCGAVGYFMNGHERGGQFFPETDKEWLMFRFFGACDIPSSEYWEKRRLGENPENPGMDFKDCVGQKVFVQVEHYTNKRGKVGTTVKSLSSIKRNTIPEDLGPSNNALAPRPAEAATDAGTANYGF